MVIVAIRFASPLRAYEPVTFSKQIAPLLQKNCQNCHRPGEAAPMSLLDYQSARPYAKSIKKVVSEKAMPPWYADPNHGEFSNDRRLKQEEIDLFAKWVDAGAPEGDPADLPKPLEFLEGWNIGKPDFVLTLPKPITVPEKGIIPYHNIALAEFPEDRWVEKIEIRPQNRNIAHHINMFVKKPSAREVSKEEVAKGGKKKEALGDFVTGYVPGGIVTEFPEGNAIFFPKGTRVTLQLHYVTSGKEESDQTSVGFVFARKPIEKEIRIALISNYFFAIPPGEPNYEVRANWKYTDDVSLIGTMVHMHLRGKDYNFVAHYPDGHDDVLMGVPKYDFNWQLGYHFKNQPHLPAGTTLEGVAHMDNSPGNKFNPDPTATVKYGPQTADEMIMGFVFYTKDGEDLRSTTGKINLGPLPTEVGGGEKKPSAPAAGAGN